MAAVFYLMHRYAGYVLIALTGGIASGKSTVAQMFAELGAVVIRADDLAREVISHGGRAHAAVLAHFGDAIVDPAGQIDRAKLAQIVFSNPEELHILETITHPAVQAELASRLSELSPEQKVIYEIPLLIEKQLFGKFDKSIAVIADLDIRAKRATDRGLSNDDFYARVEAQTTDDQRKELVDFVIYNNSDLAALAQQVREIWGKLV